MSSLPYFQTQDRSMSMLQSQWASQLNPLLNQPLSNALILKGVSLANGNTVINHRLGRTLQGWFISDVNGAAIIYRNAPKNDTTLTLNSSAAVVADIVVF